MPKENLTADGEDELEIIEADELPSNEPAPQRADDEKPSATEGDDEDDEDDEDEDLGDTRLAEHEDDEDHDDDRRAANRKKREAAKARRKAAKERTFHEINELRQQVTVLSNQLQQVAGNVAGVGKADLERRLADAKRDVNDAELIMQRAMAAGETSDFMAALKIRDEAKAAETDLQRAVASIDTRPRTESPAGADPKAQRTQAWVQANASWWNVNPEATQIAKTIDSQVAAEGYDPATPAYWSELTRRVDAAFRQTFGEGGRGDKTAGTRKKPPPQGGARNHAPDSTRKGVIVTPDRKAAMIEAGVWDDPVKRARQLRFYAQYDRENAGSN